MKLNIAFTFIGLMGLTHNCIGKSINKDEDVSGLRGGHHVEKRNLNVVRDVIMSVALQGGNEFNDIDSYQSLALDFVESEPYGLYTNDRLIQRYALACIYFATSGVENTYTSNEIGAGVTPPGWSQSTNWVTSSVDVCTWFGITCDTINNDMVIGIQMPENRMTGIFPQEVSLLSSSLQSIDLYGNDFLQGGVGVNGNAWMGQMTQLRKLFFAFCKFESTTGIPTELGLLSNLEEFDAAYNVYKGPLDGNTFANLQNLVYLDISGGKYDSPIPDQLASLPNLEDFFISDSFITGDISYLTKMTKIVQHTADFNPSLGGMIPTSGISNSILLLSYSHCGITGSIPASLGSLTNLVKLYLNDNNIDGQIPAELGSLPYLSDLAIQMNNIIDTMPAEICNNRNAGELSMGTITTLIADCDAPPTGSVVCTCCTACGSQQGTSA